MPTSKIKFKIAKSDVDGELGISEIAKVLKGLQDSIYYIAEFKNAEITSDKNKSFRIAGKRNSTIEKRVKLRLDTCKLGSFEAEVIGETQEVLQGKSMVDDSIELFSDLTYNFNQTKDILEEKINRIIPDSRHRTRVVTAMGEFWPGFDNTYDLFLETPNFKYNPLNKKRRKIIQNLAFAEQKLEEQTAIGVIEEARYLGNLKFELKMQDGKKIKCSFKSELYDDVHNLVTKPVIVKGIFTTTVGELKDVVDVISIGILKSVTKNTIISEDGELNLKKDITINTSFDRNEELWIFDFPELNIVSYGETYDKSMESFQEDFYELYEHYILRNPKKIKGNALKIRDFLLNIVSN